MTKRAAGLHEGAVKKGGEREAEPCRIEDKDFVAVFDGRNCIVEWFLKGE